MLRMFWPVTFMNAFMSEVNLAEPNARELGGVGVLLEADDLAAVDPPCVHGQRPMTLTCPFWARNSSASAVKPSKIAPSLPNTPSAIWRRPWRSSARLAASW
jgi:hypothetical protein